MTTNEFYYQYKTVDKYLLNFALQMTRDSNDAKDLLQETFLRALNNKEKFKTGTNFKAWISVLMRNLFLNQYRKQKLRRNINCYSADINNLENEVAIAEKALGTMIHQELEGVIQQLPDAYRIPFLMFYEGYHYHDSPRIRRRHSTASRCIPYSFSNVL